jgi:hypothetical protein
MHRRLVPGQPFRDRRRPSHSSRFSRQASELKHRRYLLVIATVVASIVFATPSNGREKKHAIRHRVSTTKPAATAAESSEESTLPAPTISTGQSIIPQVQQTKTVPNATPVIGVPFELSNFNSRPGSSKTIFLDFDGATVTGTDWNIGGQPLSVGPVFTSGGLIRAVWASVAEDFAPFDVNVTTQQPSEEALDRSSPQDQVFGVTVIVAAENVICPGTCNSASFFGSFGVPKRNTVWVFSTNLYPGRAVVSHEIGHTLGLRHHGTTTSEYFPEDAGWAPIMGIDPLAQPVEEEFTHWSKGDYPLANRPEQDDIAIIARQLGRPGGDANVSLATPDPIRFKTSPLNTSLRATMTMTFSLWMSPTGT